MLHLPGSLANLCKGFFPGDTTARKGHFPHLFNTPANQDYVGQIPDLKFFDLAFMAKEDSEVEKFKAWHAERRADPTPWVMQAELKAYCRNDVLMLAKLVKEHHRIVREVSGASPWFCATAPSHVHDWFKRVVSQNYELPDRTDKEAYSEAVKRAAWETGWGVLRSYEYWFARAALRGGRTDVRKIYHKVTDEDYAKGISIAYQDIVSMYPYVQAVNDYPVGLPTIEVYDSRCWPCYRHRNPGTGNYLEPMCDCPLLAKQSKAFNTFRNSHYDGVAIKNCLNVQLSPEQILADPAFFGIVCVSLTPPNNLFHPVLVTWDETEGKCVGSLEPISYGVFTSVELIVALKHGYKLDAIHRFDRYAKRPGLWCDTLKQLYVFKMANSEPAPESEEARTKLVDAYEEGFGMGDAVRESFPSWGYNAAKRQVFKILLNCGWGKHCQRANMPTTKIIEAGDKDGQSELFANYAQGSIRLNTFMRVGDRVVSSTSDNGKKVSPNLHGGYLPAGLFVPAYGRLMLYEQLSKLGDRVLYHDTDSIIYIRDPQKYNIPESDVWGKWSVEKFDKQNGGIREFVGIGPKSYGLMAANGKNYIKVKGLSLKRAHEPILNFAKMREIVLAHLDGKRTKALSIPQFTFRWNFHDGMITAPMVKLFAFQPGMLKGTLVGATLYPNGHIMAIN